MKTKRKKALKDKIEKRFRAKGVVLGKLWGGGKGSYPARTYSDTNLKRMMKSIQKDFQTGGLDSGMGFEELTGGLMDIKTISTKKIKGKPFTNVEVTKRLKLGKFKKGEKQFLEESMYSWQ